MESLEFEDSVVYRASSRTDKATHRNPVLKKKTYNRERNSKISSKSSNIKHACNSRTWETEAGITAVQN